MQGTERWKNDEVFVLKEFMFVWFFLTCIWLFASPHLSPPLDNNCLVPRGRGDWLPGSLNFLELSLWKWTLSQHLKDAKNWGGVGREVQDIKTGATRQKLRYEN